MSSMLLIGGARSGKSRWAVDYAKKKRRKAFIATAEALDEEMAQRILAHQEERGPDWTTIEARQDLAQAIENAQGHEVIVVDCLTVWVGQWMQAAEDEKFLQEWVNPVLRLIPNHLDDILFISNEVGCGIVPEQAVARRYRDLLGTINQRFAQDCDIVLYFVAGLPMALKGNIPS